MLFVKSQNIVCLILHLINQLSRPYSGETLETHRSFLSKL